jgi:hypothetical protein
MQVELVSSGIGGTEDLDSPGSKVNVGAFSINVDTVVEAISDVIQRGRR